MKKKGFGKVKPTQLDDDGNEVEVTSAAPEAGEAGEVEAAPAEDEAQRTKKEKKKKAAVASSLITPEDGDDDNVSAVMHPPATDADVDAASVPRKKKKIELVALDFESSTLHNAELEFNALIQVILNKDLRGTLWPRFNDDHFASEATGAIFQRLTAFQKLGRDWPGLMALSQDPTLPTSAKTMLHHVVDSINLHGAWNKGTVVVGDKEVSVSDPSDFNGYIFDLLDALRMTRNGIDAMVETITEIKEAAEGFDPLSGPGLVEGAATKIMSIRGTENVSEFTLNFGQFTNTQDDLKRETELDSMFAEEDFRIKTGFRNFDNKAGGLVPGEVVLVGANSGGGKTAMMLSLMKNMACAGYAAGMLQLELTLGQINERLSGNLAEVDTKILRKGKPQKHVETRIRKAWKGLHEELTEKKSRLTIFAPSAATIPQCEMYFRQYPYKVWFIDYVNLLSEASGMAGDDWKVLSGIVKTFKAMAKKYKVVIVLAVQVNVDKETGEISVRYAGGMKEHADVVWVWNLTNDARKDGIVWIQNLKARQFEPFDWQVLVELKYARFASILKEDDKEPEIDERKMKGERQINEIKPEPSSSPKPQNPAKSKFGAKVAPPSASRVDSVFVGADDEE